DPARALRRRRALGIHVGRSADAQSIPRAVHLRAHGSLVVSPRGQGARGAIDRAHEELENESTTFSGGARSRERRHCGRGAARTATRVIAPELLYGLAAA